MNLKNSKQFSSGLRPLCTKRVVIGYKTQIKAAYRGLSRRKCAVTLEKWFYRFSIKVAGRACSALGRGWPRRVRGLAPYGLGGLCFGASLDRETGVGGPELLPDKGKTGRLVQNNSEKPLKYVGVSCIIPEEA